MTVATDKPTSRMCPPRQPGRDDWIVRRYRRRRSAAPRAARHGSRSSLLVDKASERGGPPRASHAYSLCVVMTCTTELNRICIRTGVVGQGNRDLASRVTVDTVRHLAVPAV